MASLASRSFGIGGARGPQQSGLTAWPPDRVSRYWAWPVRLARCSLAARFILPAAAAPPTIGPVICPPARRGSVRVISVRSKPRTRDEIDSRGGPDASRGVGDGRPPLLGGRGPVPHPVRQARRPAQPRRRLPHPRQGTVRRAAHPQGLSRRPGRPGGVPGRGPLRRPRPLDRPRGGQVGVHVPRAAVRVQGAGPRGRRSTRSPRP